jgi:hypothetical protein
MEKHQPESFVTDRYTLTEINWPSADQDGQKSQTPLNLTTPEASVFVGGSMGSSAWAHIDPLLLNNEPDRTRLSADDLKTLIPRASLALGTVDSADLMNGSTRSKRAAHHAVHLRQKRRKQNYRYRLSPPDDAECSDIARPGQVCTLRTVSIHDTPETAQSTVQSGASQSVVTQVNDPLSLSSTQQVPIHESLHAGETLQIYEQKEKHLWRVTTSSWNGNRTVIREFELRYKPPPRKGTKRSYQPCELLKSMQKRVEQIKGGWNFLVKLMGLWHQSGVEPAFFRLATADDPVISLLGQAAVQSIMQDLALLKTPLRWQGSSNGTFPPHRSWSGQIQESPHDWALQNEGNWIKALFDLNSHMKVLDVALRVRVVLGYEGDTRLSSFQILVGRF